jgi:hypothetical protein
MVDNGGEIGAKKPLFFGFLRVREQRFPAAGAIYCAAFHEKGPVNQPLICFR